MQQKLGFTMDHKENETLRAQRFSPEKLLCIKLKTKTKQKNYIRKEKFIELIAVHYFTRMCMTQGVLLLLL